MNQQMKIFAGLLREQLDRGKVDPATVVRIQEIPKKDGWVPCDWKEKKCRAQSTVGVYEGQERKSAYCTPHATKTFSGSGNG